jgi:hypothetical protein
MKGINFQVQKPPMAESPNRMDIACFVGFIDHRPDSPRDDINQWLFQQSWLLDGDPEADFSADYLATYHRESAKELLDVPVPVESWERFTDLFAWNERDYGNGLRGAGYLAAAVRSFFAQGGRKCYVVPVASPPATTLLFVEREVLIDLLVPGFATGQVSSLANDRKSWHGVGHLLGLPEVTMLCMPDLPDLLRAELSEVPVEVPADVYGEEQFVECSEPLPVPPADNLITGLSAPTCAKTGYIYWAWAINQVTQFISRERRDVQLIATVPLPNGEINDLFIFLQQQRILSCTLEVVHEVELDDGFKKKINIGIASAFVQLAYPWLETSGSNLLPQRLEPAEGSLAGMLASNAMSRGAFNSISGKRQSDITAVHPRLNQQDMHGVFLTKMSEFPLIDRVSLYGNSINSMTLLSDVTTSNVTAHRPANVNRTISMVLRAARQSGENYVFENNGEALWAEITQHLNSVLGTLFKLGALRGKEPEEAFFVRCDSSIMSRQDLDSGRVIALVHFEPAASIESIDVVLNLQQNGQASLQSLGIERAVA